MGRAVVVGAAGTEDLARVPAARVRVALAVVRVASEAAMAAVAGGMVRAVAGGAVAGMKSGPAGRGTASSSS